MLFIYEALHTPTLRRSRASGTAQVERSKLHHKILRQGELRPHKIRYDVEKRDPDFKIKMANLLHVYKEVEIVNEYRRGEAGPATGYGDDLL